MEIAIIQQKKTHQKSKYFLSRSDRIFRKKIFVPKSFLWFWLLENPFVNVDFVFRTMCRVVTVNVLLVLKCNEFCSNEINTNNVCSNWKKRFIVTTRFEHRNTNKCKLRQVWTRSMHHRTTKTRKKELKFGECSFRLTKKVFLIVNKREENSFQFFRSFWFGVERNTG